MGSKIGLSSPGYCYMDMRESWVEQLITHMVKMITHTYYSLWATQVESKWTVALAMVRGGAQCHHGS